jgi:hypothetical protein
MKFSGWLFSLYTSMMSLLLLVILWSTSDPSKTWFTGLQCIIIIMSSRYTYWQPHVDSASQTESVTSNDQRLKTQPLNCHPQIQYGIVVRQSRWVTRVYVFVCMCVSTHSVVKHSFRKPVIWTCTFYNNYMVGYVS